jgi:hypothetical protein
MRMSDAENGEQEGAGRAGRRDSEKSGRPVPTPAEVFRRKRPPPEPAPQPPEEGERPTEEDAG